MSWEGLEYESIVLLGLLRSESKIEDWFCKLTKKFWPHFVLKTQLSCPSCIRQISRKCKSLVFTLLSNLDNYALVRLKAWNLNLIQRPFQQHTTCLHSENMYYLAQKSPIWELLPWNLRNVGLIHERLKTIYDKTRGLEKRLISNVSTLKLQHSFSVTNYLKAKRHFYEFITRAIVENPSRHWNSSLAYHLLLVIGINDQKILSSLLCFHNNTLYFMGIRQVLHILRICNLFAQIVTLQIGQICTKICY